MSQQHQQQQQQGTGTASMYYNPNAPRSNSSGDGQQQQQLQQQKQYQQQPYRASTSSGNFNLAESGIYGNANMNMPMNQPQQQPQLQPMIANYWNPTAASAVVNAASMMNNDAMLDLASSAGRTFIASGTARFVPGLERFMANLRTYFAVDNRYVKRKIITILFPYAKKHWRRTEVEIKQDAIGQQQVIYALPIDDDNAPDLYLPTMSLVTYVVLCALLYGASGKFSPEVLPDVMTKCFLTQLAEVMAMRIGFYVMDAPVHNILDFFSLTGYKYLGLSVTLFLSSIVKTGRMGYYILLMWTASSVSYLILKIMANNIPRDTASTGPKREFMVLAFAGSQLATMWFLSETKFLK